MSVFRACWFVIAAAVLLIAAVVPSPAHAQMGATGAQETDGLTVVGKGTVKARPTVAEIDLDVSAAAELTGDAIVKFRDAKKRVRDAFAALKLADVSVEERGLVVDQKGAMMNPYMMMDMGGPSKAKTEVQLSRKLVVKATKIEAMEEEAVLQLVGRLLDVAQDAGARVGPPANSAYMAYRYGTTPSSNLVRFVVEGYDKLQEAAYAKAAADARSRAEKLARLNGLELGPVLSVRVVETPARSPLAYIYGYVEPSEDDDASQSDRLVAPKFQEMPVRVELVVRFGIRPAAAGVKP